MAPFPVLVHPYDDNSAVAYEHIFTPSSSSSSPPPPANAIIFIAGLGEGPHDISFVRPVAERIASVVGSSPPGGWSVFECRLRSSFGGYAFASLRDDAEDLAELVRYLKGIGRKKIVLMGHSTGSQVSVDLSFNIQRLTHTPPPPPQDCAEYASLSRDPPLPPVDGYILQGSVSDREGHPPVDAASLAKADELIAAGRANDPMPMDAIQPMFRQPISAYRFRSLLVVG
jgi:pimeloyl-ACP methyl ester carboxylesterase